MEIWHGNMALGMWFSAGLDSLQLRVGVDDLKGLFQSTIQWIYDKLPEGTVD